MEEVLGRGDRRWCCDRNREIIELLSFLLPSWHSQNPPYLASLHSELFLESHSHFSRKITWKNNTISPTPRSFCSWWAEAFLNWRDSTVFLPSEHSMSFSRVLLPLRHGDPPFLACTLCPPVPQQVKADFALIYPAPPLWSTAEPLLPPVVSLLNDQPTRHQWMTYGNSKNKGTSHWRWEKNRFAIIRLGPHSPQSPHT